MKSQESKQSNKGLIEVLRKLFEKIFELIFRGGGHSEVGGLIRIFSGINPNAPKPHDNPKPPHAQKPQEIKLISNKEPENNFNEDKAKKAEEHDQTQSIHGQTPSMKL